MCATPETAERRSVREFNHFSAGGIIRGVARQRHDLQLVRKEITMMTTKRWTMSTALVVLLGAAMAVSASGSDFTEEIDRSYPLDRGGSVSLDNINGDVVVNVWSSDEVRVRATKSASSQELLDGLEVEIASEGSLLRIETRYPSQRRGWGRHGHTKVEYTLTVPVWAALDDIDLVNGNLRVDELEGDIDAESVNGTIELVDVAGSVEASTVNGPLNVLATRVRPGAELDLESVNGLIDVRLAPGVGAEVRAETVNGRISNDLGIDVHKGKWVGSNMRGVVGDGSIRVSLETVNGDIRLSSD
jgi:DUF4097 and DUF4098 domain-containing protein YvlB